nr:ankyrin repeat protein [Hymenolepis microstoma]
MKHFDIDWRYLIGSNDIESVLIAIENGVSPNAPIGPLSRSPLMVAIVIGSLEMVKLLLALGADRNFKDICGNTPLHLAVLNNNLEAVKLLYDRKTAETCENLDGQTPLSTAVSNNYFEIVNFMTQKRTNDTTNDYGEMKDRNFCKRLIGNKRVESKRHTIKDIKEKQQALENEVDKGDTPKWSHDTCLGLILHICMKCCKVFIKGRSKHLHELVHPVGGIEGGS